MKNKVLRRLLEIEHSQPEVGAPVMMGYELGKTKKHLQACIDAVDNKDFGFVSNYKTNVTNFVKVN